MLLGSLRYVANIHRTEGYAADILQRFHNEVRTCSLLRGGVNVVLFMGAYSTVAYEYADGLDLNPYLRSGPSVPRSKLVLVPLHAPPVDRLTVLGNSWQV